MDVHILAVTAFLFVLAVFFAVFEIEGEGKYGWAERFPTWYRVNGKLPKLYSRITGKTLTGYHAALFFVPIMLFFWPMIDRGDLSLHGAAGALANYFAWVVVWDFCWFVLNPHYGVRNFHKDKVWWFSHEPWLAGRVPSGYLNAWLMSLGLSAVSGGLEGGWIEGVTSKLQQLGWYLAFLAVLITIGAAQFHKYYHRMRRPGTDERHAAGIFHAKEDA